MGLTTPDLNSIALLTIDVQNAFVSETFPGREEKVRVLPGISGITDIFRKLGKPVIHIVRIYKRDGSNADLCRREDIRAGSGLLAPGSDGVQIIPALLPPEDIRLNEELLLEGGIQELSSHEFIVYKPRFGAFYNSSLSPLLERLGINTLAFCGFNFPNCPRASIYEASERDYRMIVIRDSISHIYEQGEKELEGIGAVLRTADELAEELGVPC